MTYSSRKVLISPGLGNGGREATDSACWSSLMISLQMSMHSLQMYTVGPAMSFLTSFCDLPQNEQRRVSSVLLTIVWGTPFETVAATNYVAVACFNFATPDGSGLRYKKRAFTRGVRLPRLLNHTPWPGPRTSIERARRRVRSVRDFDRCASPEFPK